MPYTGSLITVVTLLLLAFAVAPNDAGAQIGKVYPIDEAAQDSSFLEFRSKLIKAVEEHDTAFVVSILDSNILNSFGGDGGIEEFKNMWLSEGTTRDLWISLGGILGRGGKFIEFRGEKLFIAPYYSAPNKVKFDAYDYSVIVADSVSVHRRPNQSSETVAVLSYDVVRAWIGRHGAPDEDPKSELRWTSIQLVDSTKGYVLSSQIRSAIGFRAGFIKRHSGWRLKTLVAGD